MSETKTPDPSVKPKLKFNKKKKQDEPVEPVESAKEVVDEIGVNSTESAKEVVDEVKSVEPSKEVNVVPVVTKSKKKIKTEDTGKQLEMSICLAYNTPYDGNFKYDMELSHKLKHRLNKLNLILPDLKHTASKGNRYDFTKGNTHLSAKSTKKTGKVAPQVIGQSTPQKFCDIINIPYITNNILKQYIQNNIQSILPILLKYTFDCPNIYYNLKKDTLRYITLKNDINFTNYNFIWTRNVDTWNNSSTLRVHINTKKIPLVEWQFHTTRSNMSIRWNYENLLTIFNEHFDIIHM